MLFVQGELVKVDEYKSKQTQQITYSLVLFGKTYSDKSERFLDSEMKIGIPARLASKVIEFRRNEGQIISVPVSERIFDGKFLGFNLGGEGDFTVLSGS